MSADSIVRGLMPWTGEVAISRAKEVVRDLEAEAQHRVRKVWTRTTTMLMMMILMMVSMMALMTVTELLTVWHELSNS